MTKNNSELDEIFIGYLKSEPKIKWRTDEMRKIERLTLNEAKQAILSTHISKKDVLEALEKTKPDTRLLGCEKHWSDDSGGTCTCDENKRTAKRFYKQAIEDFKRNLGLGD